MTWANWLLGILGIWVVIVPYLGFADSALKILLVITGIVIAILGFWAAAAKNITS